MPIFTIPGQSSYPPLFHAALDLDGLVAAVDDPDVDLAGVRLLLAQEVVDARLDVGAEPRRGQVAGEHRVRALLRAAPLVAVITDVPAAEAMEIVGSESFEIVTKVAVMDQ